MSEPDDPRWLNDLSDELRRDVPVRGEWRSQLLEEIAYLPRPTASDDIDPRDDGENRPTRPSRSRRITLSPLTGVAAALLFAALGAGTMYVAVSSRTRGTSDTTIASRNTATRGSATAASSTDRELVRFQLSAPNASHVTLVGSFNEWNPVATPLVRDAATGTWMVVLRLPPGRHVYAFVVDGDVTADPAAPRAADNDFGSANSVVLVAGRTS
jgi:Glycogen recognition site of AMP-activated protein kinase